MKIIDREQAGRIALDLKQQGKTVVFTNGCFDILHAGHVRYLAAARNLGDCLIVGLNSDASVKMLKGPKRPINHEADRAEVLSALSAVDYVIIFPEKTAEALVEIIQPHIYVKGGDYRLEAIPEAKIVARHGGRTVLIPEVPGRSSSNIIRKINSDNGDAAHEL
ncbi:MAG: D-glycero-beta-D-manno-heptose 1-phosphate adenylyltransferase [Negativicutes bacterium]|nr:D-glycero-beta-D-manno-heptose 1-phosphate adenylyltransferase [Negativicutes bacterium]